MKGNVKKNISETTFFRLLKGFTKKEILEFEKFVSSPFYNSHQTLIKLFREIRKFYPSFDDKMLTREYLFEKVNSEKTYDDVIFRKYMSNLMKLAEEYLCTIDNMNHRDRKITSLLDQFERRNQISFFRKLVEQYEIVSEESGKITNESFYYKHFREELKSSFEIRTNKLHLLKPSLIKSHTYLLMHLLLTSCVYSNMMLVNKSSFKDSEDINLFEEFFEIFDIIKYLESSKYLTPCEKLFIKLCKYDVTLMKDPSKTELLKSMKSALIDLSVHLNDNLLYIFFSHLNIFYLLNISSGNQEFIRELFENYKFMIQKNLYVSGEREFINFSEYRTILLYALRLKEFEWAESFIKRFKDHHNPEMSNNILNYSMAVLTFEKGELDQSLKYLSTLELDDIILKLDSDALLLMIYYEKDYIDSALSVADSFKYYVKSNKILSDQVVKNQSDFIKYMKCILKHKLTGMSSFDYEKLREDISNNKTVRRKNWLLQKLDEIHESHSNS